MNLISETETEGVREHLFELEVNGERVPGVLWSPAGASGSRPLLLMGHGGSQNKKFPPLVSRAHKYVIAFGFAVAAIDAPGHGERKPSEQDAQFITEVRALIAEHKPVMTLVTREMERLALRTVPEWRATLDGLQGLDFVGAGGPVGYWGVSMGGATGIPLIAAEPRITAAVIGLAGLQPGQESLAAAAARISVPIEFVLQWDDEMVPREAGLALFDAFGSKEKTLHANPGGHGRITELEDESWERFFTRHLRSPKVG
jgi:dienelactone hydrolase